MTLGHHTERQVSVTPGKLEHLVCWEENTINSSLFLCELQWRHDLNDVQCTQESQEVFPDVERLCLVLDKGNRN